MSDKHETPTPLTDAIIAEYSREEDAMVPVDFARDLERQLAAKERECEELRADKERLDWLERTHLRVVIDDDHHGRASVTHGKTFVRDGLRAAIDAARKVKP